MSVVKGIYNTKPCFVVNEETQEIHAYINYHGKIYKGYARPHEEDKNFFSEKVGKTIALSKARQSALKAWVKETEKIATIKKQLYVEVTGYGTKSSAEIDPHNAFYRNVTRAETNAEVLREALKKERQSLGEYLLGQQKALSIVKRMRAIKDKAN